MPRIKNYGRNCEEWAKRAGSSVSTWDVCADCVVRGNHDLAGVLAPYNGDPPGYAGRGGADECKHPPYEKQNPPIKCAVCAKTLTEGDN